MSERVGHIKTFIDTGTQCKLGDISSSEQNEIIKVSSNDRYNTNLKGDVHGVSIGNIFEGKKEDVSINKSHVENIIGEKVDSSSSQENAHMIIHSHYDTKICIKIPEINSPKCKSPVNKATFPNSPKKLSVFSRKPDRQLTFTNLANSFKA